MKLHQNTIHIVTDNEVTIENYFPEVGNIPRGGEAEGRGEYFRTCGLIAMHH